ncbi:MAG: hypothetical protein ABMA13_13590 [Chthoniobacteraceae bacterium]
MKPHFILTASVAALALTACETTGDPQQGGLFGWSEGKAKQRQSALRGAVELEHDRGSSARAQTGRLQSERSSNAAAIRSARSDLNRMLSQLDEVDRAGGSGRTSGLRSRITQTRGSSDISDGDVRSLDSEVRSLRSEYGLLQQRR